MTEFAKTSIWLLVNIIQ